MESSNDKGVLQKRGSRLWPKADAFEPRATIRVARVKHAGNFDPEPLAWQRLALVAGNRYRIKIEHELVEAPELDAKKWPVAAMTGTDDFKLSAEQAAAIKAYLASGGTLIADAAGGSKAFDAAFEREVVPLAGEATFGTIIQEHAVYKALPGLKISYRRDYALGMPGGQHNGRLKCAQVGTKTPIIYSPDDITAGLVGNPIFGLRGYSPEASIELMTSILCYAAGVKLDKP